MGGSSSSSSSSHNSNFSASDLKDTTPETCNYDHSTERVLESNTQTQIAQEIDDLHMFVWSSSDSPISNVSSSSHDKYGGTRIGVQVHQNHKINKCISYFSLFVWLVINYIRVRNINSLLLTIIIISGR
jgi:hypothetical protein